MAQDEDPRRVALIELVESPGWDELFRLIKAKYAPRRKGLISSVSMTLEERNETVGRMLGIRDTLRIAYEELDRTVPISIDEFFMGETSG